MRKAESRDKRSAETVPTSAEAPRTYGRMLSGRRLHLLDPSPLDLDLHDLLTGISRVNRWCGQTVGEVGFNVAQHSVLVERILAEMVWPGVAFEVRRWALAHDLAEAVYGDVVTPVKAVLGSAYRELEQRLERALCLALGFGHGRAGRMAQGGQARRPDRRSQRGGAIGRLVGEGGAPAGRAGLSWQALARADRALAGAAGPRAVEGAVPRPWRPDLNMAPDSAALPETPAHIEAGTPEFRRTNLAMFAAGFSTFALLYCVQPLMPVFTEAFSVSPAASSLTVSLTTGALSVKIVIAGSLSESWGRKRIMCWSMAASALLTLVGAAATSFHQLLLLRLLMGVALSRRALRRTGLSRRGDRHPLDRPCHRSVHRRQRLRRHEREAALCRADRSRQLAARPRRGRRGGYRSAAIFWVALPESRHFTRRPLRLGQSLASLGGSFADKGLPWLYVSGFLIMGSFVTIYNYVGFRLLAPPYDLSQTQVGALFSVYLLGMVASTWTGSLADRFGRRKMLWVAITTLLVGIELTRADSVALIVLGVAIVTIGFFGAHAICSSWVARRAQSAKAQAASLYLFCYYMGSSVVGSVSGVAFQHYGWRVSRSADGDAGDRPRHCIAALLPAAARIHHKRGASMKALVTGFEPFGGEAINPAQEALGRLKPALGPARCRDAGHPDRIRPALEILHETLDEIRPDLVLCVGQAGGRPALSLERVAINVDDARIPDNAGGQPIDQPVVPGGPAAYFTTLPIKAAVAALRRAGLPAIVSQHGRHFRLQSPVLRADA
ncbi:MAG: MFS transporter [Aliidongia sp.]